VLTQAKTVERSRSWVPETDAERAAIRDQIERILASSLFRNSRRYPALFRHIVDNTLAGRTDRLKERTLGIEVFGRDPDYDTNLDPVVRTTAGEIRKRIAQYYHQPGHEGEIRIDLPSGCYVAEFRPPDAIVTAPPPPAAVVPIPHRVHKAWIVSAAIASVVIALVILTLIQAQTLTALDRFWAPVIEAPGSVLLCLGGPKQAMPITRLLERADPADGNSEISILNMMQLDRVAFSDALTLSRLAALLQTKKKPARIQRAISTRLEDLRVGPAVLIGGFNNDWTLRLLTPLRFTLERDASSRINWVQDRNNPSDRRWTVDINRSYLKMNEDYALISRIWDATTGGIVVVAAGITNFGTIAAGEFLSDPSYLEAVAKTAPAHWERKNMQFVLATKVIDDNSGPPRVVAAHYW
jgi:hypothetical protein